MTTGHFPAAATGPTKPQTVLKAAVPHSPGVALPVCQRETGPVQSLKGLGNSTYYALRDGGATYANYSGTGNGLVKFFYVRDTRRSSAGLGGFRLRHEMMMAGPGHEEYGIAFNDSIGLGSYNFDVKPGEGMGAANGGPRRLPDYMWNFTTNTGLVIRHDTAGIWAAFFSRWQRYRC